MSENEAQVQADLAKVFDIYRSAGVMDEGEILENIAFFALDYMCRQVGQGFVQLLEKFKESGSQNILKAKVGEIISEAFKDMEGVPYKTNNQLLPFIPSVTTNNDILRQIEEINWRLEAVFDNVGNIGGWFDKDLIPRLSLSSKGGRYPTPRHLISFMAGIVSLTPDDSLADFACGTGGMLVDDHCLYPWGAGNVTGIEISPNMARLAFANLVLNQQIKHDLYLGNAFDVFSKEDRFSESKFDVIMINPPFGGKIDPFLLSEWGRKGTLPFDFKANSETLFAMLAYEKLKPGGRMAVLIPNSPLFSSNSGETYFREQMVKEGALRAIISLPRDTMQPISGGMLTNVFYAVKPDGKKAPTNGVWFYRPRYDGFSEGRNRHPVDLNDLPLIQEACKKTAYGNGVQVNPHVQGEKVIGYSVSSEDQTLSYKVRELGNDYLVEVFEQSNPVETIYINGNQVYRGKPDIQPIRFDIKNKQNIEGEFSLSNMFGDFLGEGPNYSIRFKKGQGEIRKGQLHKARFGTKTKDEVQATGLLLDWGDKVISEPFPLALDVPEKANAPTGFTLSKEDEEKPFAKLLIFYEGVNGILLTQERGKENLYLCHPDAERVIGLLLDPKKRVFHWSFKIRVGEKGGVTLNKGEVFRSDQVHPGIMFNLESTVLGVYVSRQEILNTKGAGLQTERHWIEKQEPVIVRSAAQILGDIKRKQNHLTATLDRLLSISEVQAIAGTELPPRSHLVEPPAGILQGLQKSIWEIVQSQTEQAQSYVTPSPFQADDIHEKLDGNISVMDVQRALELFERMGLIVAVSYEGAPYYRLPEERDLFKREEK